MDSVLSNIIKNWDLYYKSYKELNPDLEINGITDKRALLNHYVKHGYKEKRLIDKKKVIITIIKNDKQETNFELEDNMFIDE